MLLAGLLLASALGRPTRAVPLSADAETRETEIARLLGAVDVHRCGIDVERLTGERPICVRGNCRSITNRLTGSPDLEHAMRYLASELEAAGYQPAFEAWRGRELADRNLLTRATGVISPAEEVYVVAHVDGVGSCPDPRCPAADDNASGTVAALELGRVFAGRAFARTVVLLFSTGEEQGCLGVEAYIARRGAVGLEAIHALVNVDMLGYDSDDDNVMELYHGNHPPSLAVARSLEATIRTYVPELRPRLDPGCG